MNARRDRDENGKLITLEQACRALNLGKVTVRRLAEESGAARRIGEKIYRIDRPVLFDFIDQKYS